MIFSKKNENIRRTEERRQHLRIKKNYVLKYFLKSSPDEKFEITQLKNISLGGMCFITTDHYPPETILSIELKTPYVSETTFFEGRVLQSHEKAGTLLYHTRLEFFDIDDHAHILLKKIIEITKKETG